MNDSGCEDTVPTMVPVCKLPDESDASMRARLFTSLSQSFPHSQLYKALHGGEDINLNGGDNSEDDDDSLYGDHLSNSCFASLRMDRRDSDDFDDDLQSLEWLQSEDLLKNIGGEKLDKDEDDNEEQKENEDIKPDINALQAVAGQQPATIPYLPQKHVNSKPPYSFSCLIFMAVEASPQKRLPVKDIYNWILTQFPYFQNAPTGWKNSVRHNLSLNKCFKKVEKDKGQSIGKGSLWCIDPAYRPNLLQALRKTPYHPYHQLQMTSTQPHSCIQYHSLPGGDRIVLPLTQRPVPNTVSPHLFPFLSRRLAQTSIDVDNEMKDVAQTLVALKSSHKMGLSDNSAGEDIGPTWKHHKRSNSNSRKRPSSPVVVTDHPYDDHAYSSSRLLDDDLPSPSSSSSIDEEYEFGDAVLSYLLRHTGDTADELFQQLDCSELSFPISDHFFCPHNEESDYQSDMEWDSDDKDEVDGGDIQSHRRLKIDIHGEGSTSTNSKGHDSEDDEQKKIHEGASALLNLAGLYRSNSSTSNSPDCVKERKKKVRLGDKLKKSDKAVKASKKGKDKKQVFSSKTEGEGSRKRSVSKRKNAGSNGKYDNEDYSLIKINRTPTKGRPPNPDKVSKSKLIKSSTKDPAKIASLTTKAKTSVKAPSKGVKKNIEKKKLKLSKNFGSSKKQVAALPVDKVDDLPAGGKTTKSTKAKKLLSNKERSQTASGALRKSKSLNAGMKGKSYNSASFDDLQVESADHSIMPIESLNNNHVKSATVSLKTSDDAVGSDKQLSAHKTDSPNDDLCCESSSKKGLLSTSVSSGIISPAGDAPSVPLANAKDSESKHPVIKLATSSINRESSHNLNQVSSIKNGIKNSAASDLASGLAVSHKSPHFTRFSKKKAALS